MAEESRTGGMMFPDMRPLEDRGGMAIGAILATAVAAGIVAFLLRRNQEEQEPANRVARIARDWSNNEGVEASREFLAGKILPELRPAILAILNELEDVVDQSFRRMEKRIKKL